LNNNHRDRRQLGHAATIIIQVNVLPNI